MTRNIFIASDHAGFSLKSFFVKSLSEITDKDGFKSFNVYDLGCDSELTKVSYVDITSTLCLKLIEDKKLPLNTPPIGIIVCGSGVGVTIAANRFNEIRAVNCNTPDIAILSRKHNDSNVICFGARLMTESEAMNLFTLFIKTEFEGGRHSLRVESLDKINS